MANITKTFVDNIPFIETGQQIFWDDKLKGFGLVVGKTAKTFIVQLDVRGKAKRKKVGRYSEALTVASAKGTAKEWLSDLGKKIVPWEVEAAKRDAMITFKQVWDSFIADKEKIGSAATLRNYKYIYEQHLKIWDKKDIATINVAMVKKKHSEIGENNGKYLANSVFRVFRAVYTYALDELDADIPRNPVKKRLWYKETPRKNPMKPEVLPVFWKMLDEYIDTPMRRDYYRLVLFTGLRRGSANSIRANDIDLDAKTLHIPNPKGGEEKAFNLPLSDYLCTLIKGLLEGNETDWLFPSRNSKSGHIAEPKEPGFIKALEKETAYHLMIHGLRSTFITYANKLDISQYKIKLLVNHAVPKKRDVTDDYTDIDVDDLREPMQRITTRLLSLLEPEEKGKKVVGIRR